MEDNSNTFALLKSFGQLEQIATKECLFLSRCIRAAFSSHSCSDYAVITLRLHRNSQLFSVQTQFGFFLKYNILIIKNLMVAESCL